MRRTYRPSVAQRSSEPSFALHPHAGAAFLRRAFDEGAAFLEGVTGLDELQASTAAMVLEDMEEFEEEEGGAGDNAVVEEFDDAA